jgi:hypothetical protein
VIRKANAARYSEGLTEKPVPRRKKSKKKKPGSKKRVTGKMTLLD